MQAGFARDRVYTRRETGTRIQPYNRSVTLPYYRQEKQTDPNVR